MYGEVEFHCDKAVSSGVTREDRERYLPEHEGAAEQLYGELPFCSFTAPHAREEEHPGKPQNPTGSSMGKHQSDRSQVIGGNS
mgnify:CR=1 FL=1